MNRLFAYLISLAGFLFVSTAAFSFEEFLRCEQPLENGLKLVGEFKYEVINRDSRFGVFSVLLEVRDSALDTSNDAPVSVELGDSPQPAPFTPVYYQFAQNYTAYRWTETKDGIRFRNGYFQMGGEYTKVKLPEFLGPIYFRNCYWPQAGVTVHN